MENARNSIDNINNNILPGIQDACASQGDLCDGFKSKVDGVLWKKLYQNSLPNLPNNIQTNLADLKFTVSDVDKAGQMSGLKDEINSIIINTVRDIDIFRGNFEIPEMISSNFQYIHTGVLAVGGVLSLILGLVLLGLTCGCCSKPGSGPTKTGASLIRGAFSGFFILAALLFILCAALLLVGAISEKAVCNSLREPEDSQVFQLADKFLQQTVFNDLYNGTFNLSISEVIHGIHNNTPLYPLLHLDVVFDVETAVRNEVNKIVDDFKGKIEETTKEIVKKSKEDIPSTDITNAAAEIDSRLNPVITDILQTDVSTVIEDIITQIEDIITDTWVTDQGLEESLQKLISELTNLKNKTITVQESFQDILENPGIAENQNLILETFSINTFNLVDEAFQKIPENVVENLLNTIDQEIPVIVSSIEQDVGKTEILSNIYNATYTLTCLDIIAPVNSVWSGLGLTLLTMILLSLLLHRLQENVPSLGKTEFQLSPSEIRQKDELREEI